MDIYWPDTTGPISVRYSMSYLRRIQSELSAGITSKLWQRTSREALWLQVSYHNAEGPQPLLLILSHWELKKKDIWDMGVIKDSPQKWHRPVQHRGHLEKKDSLIKPQRLVMSPCTVFFNYVFIRIWNPFSVRHQAKWWHFVNASYCVKVNPARDLLARLTAAGNMRSCSFSTTSLRIHEIASPNIHARLPFLE